jgi:RES domain-containing protein
VSSPSSKTISGWRIVKSKHSDSAFSGEGARLFGGRWNSPGAPVVYLSEHQSLGALEILVHMQPITPRDRFTIFRIEWTASSMESISTDDLPLDWQAEPPGRGSQTYGDRWVRERRSAVLAVPSVLLPAERNFILNPEHPGFAKLRIGDPIDFTFDGRLLNR